MKTRYKITLISLCILFGVYASIISYIEGPEDILNISSVFYFPGIVMQLVANEGNGIMCADACGPCSAWGTHYVLIDGKCELLENVEDCYAMEPSWEWEFIDNNCVVKGIYNEHIQQLQEVLDSCACQESDALCDLPGLSWANSTHFINNNTCEWQ